MRRKYASLPVCVSCHQLKFCTIAMWLGYFIFTFIYPRWIYWALISFLSNSITRTCSYTFSLLESPKYNISLLPTWADSLPNSLNWISPCIETMSHIPLFSTKLSLVPEPVTFKIAIYQTSNSDQVLSLTIAIKGATSTEELSNAQQLVEYNTATSVRG